MKITSTPQQQQFTGCYVLKDTQNAYKTIVNEIMPTFRILAPHHPVFAVKEDLIIFEGSDCIAIFVGKIMFL